jgi:hypothetical protein
LALGPVKPSSSSFFGLVLGLACISCAAGCAAEDGVPSELVSAPTANVALAFVRDGDSLYVARAAGLERIDARSGVVSQVAGPEWAECPRDPRFTWLATELDYGYPNLVIRGTTLFLLAEQCGLWSFDVVTRERRMLVDPSFETREKRTKEEGVFPDGATWNGKTGPDWVSAWGMAIAADEDGLLGCFQANVDEPDPTQVGGHRYRSRLELWSFSVDGTPREMLTSVSREREATDGQSYCKHIIADETSILFSTDRAILRLDRKTRAVTTLVSGLRYGAQGLAQDASSIFYIGLLENDVRSMPRDGGVPIVLRASSHDGREPTRMMVTLDGDHVFFHEGYSLLRMQKDGSGSVVLAEGNQADWIIPMTLGIADHHVYFERMTETLSEKRRDDGSTSFERTFQGALYRTAR